MKNHLLSCLFCLFTAAVLGQFQTNGTAISQGSNCFRLTRNLTTQSGSVWNLNRVDISKPFDLYFEVNLGCSNGGADGMAFVLQPISSSVGSSGGGLGYQGINPSLAIEMDTYQNGNYGDPVFDHLAIMSNGNNSHSSPNNLAGPVAAIPGNGNLEDCQFHDLRILWDTATTTLSVYLDCSLRLTYTGNIVQTIFNNNPNVFWGFTAATGALTNEHRFCFNYISFTQALQDTAICQGDTLQLNVGTGFSYTWTPAAGLSDTTIANPKAFPDSTTKYYVTVTDPCNNSRLDSVTITVQDSAALQFDLGPADTILCGSSSLPLNLARSGVNYLWQNGSTMPNFTINTAGQYWAELSNLCGAQRDTIDVLFESFPSVNLGPDTLVCDSPSLLVDATFISLTSQGTQYLWQDGSTMPSYSLSQNDTLIVQLSNYCGTASDSLAVRFLQSPQPFSLGRDSVLCDSSAPFLLNAYQAGMTYTWSNGSQDSAIVASTTGLYQVDVQNACGIETDDIRLTFVPPLLDFLPPDTTICIGSNLSLSVNAGALYTINWSNGTTGTTYIASYPDHLIVCGVGSPCGIVYDSIRISYDSIPQPNLGLDTSLCASDSITLNLFVANATSYQWQAGPATAQWRVSSPALYIGEASNRCGTGRDSITIGELLPPDIDLGPDQLLCDRDSIVLDFSNQNWQLLWQDGSTEAIRTLQDSGLYWIIASNRCGMDTDSLYISEEQSPELNLPIEDTVICEGEILQLDISAPNIDSYLWSDSSLSSTFSTSLEQQYWAQVSNVCGVALDSFQLWVDTLPAPDLGPDTALCEGERLIFNVFQTRASYLWQDASVLATNNTVQAGDYWVEVTNSCGTVRDDLSLIIDQKPPEFSLGADRVLCTGDSILLDAYFPSSPTAPISYAWLDGATDSIRWVMKSGLYRLELTNRCGRTADLMEVLFELPLEPDLGQDTLRCQNEQIVLNGITEGATSYRWQDGSSEEQFIADAAGIYWLTVENTCGQFADTVMIEDTDCNCTVFLPSAFTPNGDNSNDQYCISYECEFLNFDLQIYNRWGRLIWQSNSPTDCWDGRFQGAFVPEGVYVYVLTFESLQNKRDAKETRSGTITVIR